MQAKPSGSNYYETLGVVKDASVDLIKAAYQRLVMKLHPDKAGSESHEQFQQLQEAWQVCCVMPAVELAMTTSSHKQSYMPQSSCMMKFTLMIWANGSNRMEQQHRQQHSIWCTLADVATATCLSLQTGSWLQTVSSFRAGAAPITYWSG
eukprot:GHRR01025409.1.p1 GENE.GHRR01025409.1~~GHRR01025409.1.p1  ORF type:complete len:150 (+),score=45.72 GHRR01025409.1:119-568(+)